MLAVVMMQGNSNCSGDTAAVLERRGRGQCSYPRGLGEEHAGGSL